MKKRPHKYGAVATVYDGVRYDSKAEALRAQELDILFSRLEDGFWLPQVKFRLGLDFSTRVDFLCINSAEDSSWMPGTDIISSRHYCVWAEEIKGHETSDFKRVRRLWKKYGPIPLIIKKRIGNVWSTEVID